MQPKSIKTVGIAGAGTMGQGIAQVCAVSGFDVFLYDAKSVAVQKGISRIEASLQKNVEKNRITPENKTNSLSRITECTNIHELKADLIIEAAVENLDVKKELFQTLGENNPYSLLTTNTSSIPVTQIAAGITNRDRFAGLHFFNPAPVMKLVEIIQGVDTSLEVVETLKEFSKKLGKTPVVAKDSPGFIVNRVARHYYVEALKILEENNVGGLIRTDGPHWYRCEFLRYKLDIQRLLSRSQIPSQQNPTTKSRCRSFRR